MKLVDKQCPKCSGQLMITGRNAVCDYCGSSFMIRDDDETIIEEPASGAGSAPDTTEKFIRAILIIGMVYCVIIGIIAIICIPGFISDGNPDLPVALIGAVIHLGGAYLLFRLFKKRFKS